MLDAPRVSRPSPALPLPPVWPRLGHPCRPWERAPRAALRLSVYGQTYCAQPPHLALAGHDLPSLQPGTGLVLAQAMLAEVTWRAKQGDKRPVWCGPSPVVHFLKNNFLSDTAEERLSHLPQPRKDRL